MKMEPLKFRIGYVAQQLNLERFVIRFWEKEFEIKPKRSEGGQRFYSNVDLKKFKTIKQLLHHDGFTIAGAKKLLTQNPSKVIASTKTTLEESPSTDLYKKELAALKHQLLKLKELL